MVQIGIQSLYLQRRRTPSSSSSSRISIIQCCWYIIVVVSIIFVLLCSYIHIHTIDRFVGTTQLVHATNHHQQYTYNTNHKNQYMQFWNRSLQRQQRIPPTTSTITSKRIKYNILLQQVRGGGGGSSSRSRIINHRSNGAVVPSSSKTTTTSKASSSSPNTTTNTNNNDSILQIINLIKTIIGAGILGIPAGMVHSFDNNSNNAIFNVILPTSILFISIGLLAAYGFYMIGTICSITDSTNYAMAWNTTVSSNTMILPNIACIMVTFCTLLTYSMVLADTIPTLIRPILTSINPNTVSLFIINRNIVLLFITISILLPLCLLQSLKSLAPFSFIGICGILYTAIIMILRYYDQSYNIKNNGYFVSTIESKLRPNFDPTTSSINGGGSTSKNVAILISMLSTAYMAHYNAPKFYWELHRSSSTSSSTSSNIPDSCNSKRGNTILSSTKSTAIKVFRNVVFQSYSIAILLMLLIASMGYLTFGNHCQSVILNNYSTQDTYMSLSRWAIVISLIFSYPLAFVGVRDGIYNILHIDRNAYRYTNQITTIVLLSIITFIASVMKDIRIILSLGGATFGTLLSYVFPAIMVIGLANKQKENAKMNNNKSNSKQNSDETSFPSQNQVRFSYLTAMLGIAMGVIGTTKAIQSM